MSLVTQSEVFSLIADLNAFADRAETTIIQARSRYDQNKQSLAKKHTSVLAQLEASYKANCNSISSKSKKQNWLTQQATSLMRLQIIFRSLMTSKVSMRLFQENTQKIFFQL